MPIEFTVVGEHSDDVTQLLVMGADGKYYGYTAARDHFPPVEPDDQWIVQQQSEDLFVDPAEWASASS